MLFLGIGLAAGYVILRSFPGSGNWLRLLAVGAPIVGLLGLGNLVYYAIVRNHRPEPSADRVNP